MAIVLEAFSVIVRNEALANRYPGGREAFEMNIPNRTFCADDSLSRCSFMVESDAREFIREIEQLGLSASGQDLVLCNSFHQTVTPNCDWLQLGHYQDTLIGWLAGEEVKTIIAPAGWTPERSASLVCATNEEAARRLKYLRREENVFVYWDQEANQEVYVGRTQFPLDDLFEQAGKIVSAHLRNPGAPPAERDSQIEILRAVEMLEAIIERVPDNWRPRWFLGKAWHALGNSEKAYAELQQAFELDQTQIPILKELSGICLELGKGKEAVRLSQLATEQEPGSGELLANLAVAHLIAADYKKAQMTIRQALQAAPEDPINRNIQRLIEEVAKGRRAHPRNLEELTK